MHHRAETKDWPKDIFVSPSARAPVLGIEFGLVKDLIQIVQFSFLEEARAWNQNWHRSAADDHRDQNARVVGECSTTTRNKNSRHLSALPQQQGSRQALQRELCLLFLKVKTARTSYLETHRAALNLLIAQISGTRSDTRICN